MFVNLRTRASWLTVAWKGAAGPSPNTVSGSVTGGGGLAASVRLAEAREIRMKELERQQRGGKAGLRSAGSREGPFQALSLLLSLV